LVSNQSKRGTAKGAKSAGPPGEPEGDPATLEVAADLSAERLLSAPLRDEHVQRLEGELRLTRERLQATIEELESTNEELKTSKEELQSVNEELQTLNGELAHRVQDLGRVNSDLKNLLESTQPSSSLFRLSGDGSRLTEVWGSLFRQHSAGVEPSTGWLTEYIHPDDRNDMAETMARAFETGSPYELEHRGRRADGGWGWVVSRAVPVRNEAGEIIEWLGTATDITERKRAEEAQQALISELQHRTRNLLAIVSSLSRQTLRTSETLADYEREFGDRLLALSRVQNLLSQGDGFTVTLGELVKGELEAHGAGVDGRRVLVEGPEVTLSSKEVQILTLAMHELATNAIKYGALRSPDANLSIRWRHLHQDGQHYILINWSEEGVAYPGAPDGVKRGFGRELIERALPYDLGAETSFALAEDGVRCELKLPVRPPSEFRSPTRDRPNGGSRPGGS
jgi:two-component system CheB/CheR fusion protein